ncbi:MAG: hypothetical protein ACM3VV_02715 [Deltaproteobacteria bacterium]
MLPLCPDILIPRIALTLSASNLRISKAISPAISAHLAFSIPEVLSDIT